MIPRLQDSQQPDSDYAALLAELQARGFAGDLTQAEADRTVLATDNSIYQRAPAAVAFPRNRDDLVRIMRCLADPRFSSLTVTPRGGGTGTNGQSLSDGLVVDVSRHMNRILDIDVREGWARVEAGVVKDQLNAALAEHGLFFAPDLSTSSRATIGGMISTDACGQGSCLYGKTSNHVLELTTVLADGTLWRSAPLGEDELKAIEARDDLVGTIHRTIAGIARDHDDLIRRHFPKLNRSLTGYDLAQIRRADGRFDLNAVICGSEGTLGLLAEAKIRVLPIPARRVLVNIRYESFDAALRDAPLLMGASAASIETVDSGVLALARQDSIWDDVRAYFPDHDGAPAKGVNIVEFVGQTDAAVDAPLARLLGALAGGGKTRVGHTIARDRRDIDRIWEMRKRAVGLLGNTSGEKRPVAFVEDTVVPPEHLADYIAEFRAALDRRNLAYGMFGHVDAGVLHVRPALDLKDRQQRRLVREVTEEVRALTERYGGLLWGEHGKGVRSEFSPKVFGPLYPMIQAVKAAFDPDNRLNPGKIAAPAGHALMTIDTLPLKGELDAVIPPDVRQSVGEALHCNGNGACYSWDPTEAMCPSWKGTRDRRHSPKGRAQIMREWLRQLAVEGVDPLAESARLRRAGTWRDVPARIRNARAGRRGATDFSHEVKAVFDGCLSCKACAGQCPVKVDVPAFRARFLELYYGRYQRPLRDYLVGAIEHMAPLMAVAPVLSNALAASSAGRKALAAIGLVHTPGLTGINIRREQAMRNIAFAVPDKLAALPDTEKERSVVIIQDAFTSYYETRLLLDTVDLIAALGLRPFVAPFRPNGKALHVQGFLKGFETVARRTAVMLQELAATGVPLIGLDPSMTLAYRSEYRPVFAGTAAPEILLPQEWLIRKVGTLPRIASGGAFRLLPHCTERTTAAPAMRDWVSVFEAMGLELKVLPAGCCGMAGTWGHQAENRATSEHIYRLSWAEHVTARGSAETLLADGYSCRSQAKLVDGVALRHPVQALLAAIRA